MRRTGTFRTFGPLETIPSGGFLHHRHRGTMYPPFIDLAATEILETSWETAANDIFICTHQKVGTHLTKRFIVEILRHAMAGTPGNIYETGDIGHGTVPWPEVMISQYGQDHFEEHLRRTSHVPRVWYIHSRIEQLPFSRIHPETRFVVVHRDPRAVAVSQYFFYRQHPLLCVLQDLTLDGFVDLFVDGDLYFGEYHSHAADWIAVCRPDIEARQVLSLTYEQLVEHKTSSVRQLSSFLLQDWYPSDDIVDAVVQATGFDAMRREITQNPQSFHLDPTTFFRSGQVRDWERHLSAGAVAAIDAKTRSSWKKTADGDSC